MNVSTVLISGVAGFLGAILGIVSKGCSERVRELLRAKSIAASLVAEIDSVIEMTDRRRYVQHFKSILHSLKTIGDQQIPYIMGTPDEDDPVLNSVRTELGLLGPELSKSVGRFYIGLHGIRQDLRNMAAGLVDHQSKIALIEEDLELWDRLRGEGNLLIDGLTQFCNESTIKLFFNHPGKMTRPERTDSPLTSS